MLGWLIIALIVMVLVGSSMAGGMMFMRPDSPPWALVWSLGGIFLASLLTLLLVPLLMAIWFAPALVFFNGMAPFAAMQASMSASLKTGW